ncbi:MAG TPA: WxcM-like domain-containing protein [Patescibacteria group bacterium]
MNINIKKLEIKSDDRGWLTEILNAQEVYEEKFGQLIVTTALSGKTKGKHYHKRKKEWFCVIKGNGLLSIKNRETGEVWEQEIGENNMVIVEIPVGMWHAIANTGSEEMFLLTYTNETFNPQDTDTYYE